MFYRTLRMNDCFNNAYNILIQAITALRNMVLCVMQPSPHCTVSIVHNFACKFIVIQRKFQKGRWIDSIGDLLGLQKFSTVPRSLTNECHSLAWRTSSRWRREELPSRILKELLLKEPNGSKVRADAQQRNDNGCNCDLTALHIFTFAGTKGRSDRKY